MCNPGRTSNTWAQHIGQAAQSGSFSHCATTYPAVTHN